MRTHLLLLDVGNTNVKFAVTRADAAEPPRECFSLPTRREDSTSDFWGFRMLEVLRLFGVAPEQVEAVVVSSVAPPLDPMLTRAARRFLGCETLFVPADLPAPLENRYAKPGEVGADRLVVSAAARALYPEPVSLIVIDFGTATTFDCVEGQAYLGGLICPGVLSSTEALASKTAKLPRITLELDSPDIAIGRSTFDSLNQGVVFGFAAMSEGVVERLKRILPPPTLVVATGGFAPSLAAVCSCFDKVEPDLLMAGLHMLYRKARNGERDADVGLPGPQQ